MERHEIEPGVFMGEWSDDERARMRHDEIRSRYGKLDPESELSDDELLQLAADAAKEARVVAKEEQEKNDEKKAA